jgi:hypothetical protein
MITKLKAITSLVPDAQVVITDNNFVEWISPSVAPITEEQIQDEITRLTLLEPFDECKNKAKRLIAATDWAVLPDVGLQNKADFESYRAQLRALIVTPVADPVWPTEPEPVWS